MNWYLPANAHIENIDQPAQTKRKPFIPRGLVNSTDTKRPVAIERAVILCQDQTILAEHLPERTSRSEELEPSNILEYEAAKDSFEKKYLRNLLKQTEGNVTDAARVAQMTRQNIYLKLKKYEINPKVYYPRE